MEPVSIHDSSASDHTALSCSQDWITETEPPSQVQMRESQESSEPNTSSSDNSISAAGGSNTIQNEKETRRISGKGKRKGKLVSEPVKRSNTKESLSDVSSLNVGGEQSSI